LVAHVSHPGGDSARETGQPNRFSLSLSLSLSLV
jgi:hypothetical protein